MNYTDRITLEPDKRGSKPCIRGLRITVLVWVRLGNCSSKAIEDLLRDHLEDVTDFEADATATFLILS